MNLGLPGDQNRVSVFVMKESGLPFSRAAATPRIISTNVKGKMDHVFHCLKSTYHVSLIVESIQQISPIKYEFHLTSTGICITCTFLDSSTTDCVAVVHQRISQLSSSGLMNIESSHKCTISGNTAYGCIEGVNLEQYQVGVMESSIINEQS